MPSGYPERYSDVLRDLWRAHISPREAHAPTVVSLFAGCGGSSLGYSAAGFRELLAVEWESHAADMLRLNFPHVPVHHGDVAQVTPDVLDIEPGTLDVLDGSPPCQGFSTVGLRQLDDPRNALFLEFVRLLRAWQPRTFVMENVAGMAQGSHATIYHEAMAALRDSGYRVTARIVEARRLGVPTLRKRLIIIGVRDDLYRDPVHPTPLPYRPRTFGQAVADLPDLGLIEYPRGTVMGLIGRMPPGKTGRDVLLGNEKKGDKFGIVRITYSRPAPTIVKTFSNGFAGMIHPTESRYVSHRELMRIQSFPDEYDWGDSTYKQIHNRIGNSVPPLMAFAIAKTIRERILNPVGAAP